jgi:hypothetical protein
MGHCTHTDTADWADARALRDLWYSAGDGGPQAGNFRPYIANHDDRYNSDQARE